MASFEIDFVFVSLWLALARPSRQSLREAEVSLGEDDSVKFVTFTRKGIIY